jgi:catalase
MPINNTGGSGIWPQGIRYNNSPQKSANARLNITPYLSPLSVKTVPAVENTPVPPPAQEVENLPTPSPAQRTDTASDQPENVISSRGVAPAPENGEMTDSLGRPIPNDMNSLTVGPNGPTLLEDIHFIDKLAHFDRERIPERVVHAKGAGAFGSFICYESMASYTMAEFLNRKGKQTPVFVRFSTVIGGRGSADTVRDPRGFAVKFYTNEGIYDLVGNDLPVFFIRDAIKFPDVIHSLKPAPDTNTTDPQRFWDFISLTPEAIHMITWLYSDRGTIRDYRHIDGFGVNTYVWVNRNSERLFVKFHWKTVQGLETIDRHEAVRLAGSDPDIAVKRLYDAIARGDYPKYELCVQLMKPEEASTLPFDPLDDTKVWPEDAYPLMKVGMMTLNRNPENFFAQVEQAAFCPGNIVPGIEFSADKMLQGRSFSYLDTQRHRIGPNFMQLPVNRSLNQPYNNQRDGSMTYKFNPSPINYSPNSLNGNRPLPATIPVPRPVQLSGEAVRQSIPKTDDFTQAGERFRSLDKVQREHLVDNIAVELWKCRPDIIRRVTGYFERADPDFATEVTRAMDAYRKAG